MTQQLKILIGAAAFVLLITGVVVAGTALSDSTSEESDGSRAKLPEYRKISADEAKKMMDEADGVVLLDVRTDEEYREQHIPGAILIPDYEIAERAEAELPATDALILVYCRTGRRSTLAARALVGMGYTNVYDFGGIIDWRYETE